MTCEPQIHASRVPLLARPLIIVVRLYQATLGHFMGGQCRFHPSCSNYAIEALQTHGAWRGTLLIARRLLRCHPFGGGGWDPVPPKRSESSD